MPLPPSYRPQPPNLATIAGLKMVREGHASKTVLLFGLVSIALVAVVGTLVDLSRLDTARNELQQRLDTALVAGAKEEGGDRIEIAEAAFDRTATGSIAKTTMRQFKDDNGGLSGTVTAAVPTTLSSVIGIRAIRVVATGHAERPGTACVGADNGRHRRADCTVAVRSSTRAVPAVMPPSGVPPS